jgi:outer membrane lipoprotein carrier protein
MSQGFWSLEVAAGGSEARPRPNRLYLVVMACVQSSRLAGLAPNLKAVLAYSLFAFVLFWCGAVLAVVLPAGEQPLPAQPGSSELKDVLRRIQRHYRLTDSFSAKFTEEIVPVGGTKRVREGLVYYRRPGRMRWDFAAPQGETIVSDGKLVYSYQPDLNQVIEIPIKQAFKSASATAFVLGIGNIERDFNASLAPSQASNGPVRVELVPKAGGDKIQVGLDPRTYDVVTLKLTDGIGNVTELHFSDIRTNIGLKDSLFVFTAPEGADIVGAPGTP